MKYNELFSLMIAIAVGLACLSFNRVFAQNAEVSFAAFTLPDPSSGMLHWRSSSDKTEPIQLSTRYFSDRYRLKSNVVEFYESPLVEPKALDKPEPLLIVVVPEGLTRAYMIIHYNEKEQKWHASILDSKDWLPSTMRVYNSFGQMILIEANKRPFKVNYGKHLDFKADDYTEEGFEVKIHRTVPDVKEVFSSRWRVNQNRRELLFIGNSGGALKFRSLIELDSR